MRLETNDILREKKFLRVFFHSIPIIFLFSFCVFIFSYIFIFPLKLSKGFDTFAYFSLVSLLSVPFIEYLIVKLIIYMNEKTKNENFLLFYKDNIKYNSSIFFMFLAVFIFGAIKSNPTDFLSNNIGILSAIQYVLMPISFTMNLVLGYFGLDINTIILNTIKNHFNTFLTISGIVIILSVNFKFIYNWITLSNIKYYVKNKNIPTTPDYNKKMNEIRNFYKEQHFFFILSFLILISVSILSVYSFYATIPLIISFSIFNSLFDYFVFCHFFNIKNKIKEKETNVVGAF